MEYLRLLELYQIFFKSSKRGEKWQNKHLERITPIIFPKLIKNMKPWIQAQQTSSRINTKTITFKQIIMKSLNTKNKEKIFLKSKEKNILHSGIQSQKLCQISYQKQWDDIFKML